MLYPQWASLTRDAQARTINHQNLGHALTHIRRALPERGHPGIRHELADAWKLSANGPDGYTSAVERAAALMSGDELAVARDGLG